MWDFDFSKSTALMGRTMPFIVLRFTVFFGITLAYIIFTGGGGAIGYLIGSAGSGNTAEDFTLLGAIFGFSLVSGALYFFREYLLYLVKAGHIAVLVRLLDGQPLPEGRGQIKHALEVVKSRFGEASILFAVDQLIKGILRTFNRVVLTVSNVLPIPGLENIMKFVTAVINLSLTYVDEVILAYNIRTDQDNPWSGARDGLVLYAQNYKLLLKNALWLTVFGWLLTALIFILVFFPVAALVVLFPGVGGFWTILIAAIAAYSLKAALIDPIAMTSLMQAYFKAIEGQVPRQDWIAKLDAASAKFKELASNATNFSRHPASRSKTA